MACCKQCGLLTCGLIAGILCGGILALFATGQLLMLLYTTWLQDWYNATSIYDIKEHTLIIYAYIEVGVLYFMAVVCAIYTTCAVWIGVNND